MSIAKQDAEKLKDLIARCVGACLRGDTTLHGSIVDLDAFIDRLGADSVGAEPVLINATSDELSRENDGSIAIDWITKDRDMLTMSLAKDGTLSWAVHRAGPQGSGTAQLNEACFWTLNQCLDEAEALAAPSPAPAVPSEDDPEMLALAQQALDAMAARTPEEAARGAAAWVMGLGGNEGTTALASSQQPTATSEPVAGWQPEMHALIQRLRAGDWSLRSPDELACMIADMLERAMRRLAHQPAASEEGDGK